MVLNTFLQNYKKTAVISLFHLNGSKFILFSIIKPQQILALVKRQFELFFIFAVHILVDGNTLLAFRFQERAHAAFGEAVFVHEAPVKGKKHFAVVEFPVGDVVFDETCTRQAAGDIHASGAWENMLHRVVKKDGFSDGHAAGSR